MKRTIQLALTALFCSMGSVLMAQPININTAKTIGENHLSSIGASTFKSTHKRGFSATSIKAFVEKKDTLYYVLNDTINKGFVIVSADKRIWPILGYSTESSFDEENQPEAFKAWMNNRKKEIEYIKKNNLQANSTIRAKWEDLNFKASTNGSSAVGPLLQTQWDQELYYNAMCPADPRSNTGHAPVGCTNTAMAQIMKYWNFPTKGTGSFSYLTDYYGQLSVDFGSTTYQWSQMPNHVTEPNDAVATLMFHCGVANKTEYKIGGSGAWSPRDGLIQYFNYSPNTSMIFRDGYTTDVWIDILKSELDLKHPIWYVGNDIKSFPHAFVCDGYQDNDYFHCNWGWSGRHDGYYYLGELNPATYHFNDNHFAVINIVPNALPDGYNGLFLSANTAQLPTNGGTTTIDVFSSTNWTATSDQSWLILETNTGGSSKTSLNLRATGNTSNSDRSALVTITTAEFGIQTIQINQLKKIQVTPGNLYRLLAEKATRITHLTLKGTIDARDFKAMRDAMPFLTDIDLSEVTIAAYTGSEGPVDDVNFSYAANAIPNDAFNSHSFISDNHIKSVILPATLNEIETMAFAQCKNLSSLYIPATVTKIDNGSFYQSGISVDVDPNNSNFSSIDGALLNKNQTVLIYCPISKEGIYKIPDSVTKVEDKAFSNCNRLTSVFIPASVTQIGTSFFGTFSALLHVDPNNLNYSSIDGILFNKDQTWLIHCPSSIKGNYIIPSSVTTVCGGAFSNCAQITKIEVPPTVRIIGSNAFQYCSGLSTLTIPPSITKIQNGTFSNCLNLTSLVIQGPISIIGNYAFYNCFNLKSLQINAVIPVNVDTMSHTFDDLAYYKCTLHVPYGSKSSYQKAATWSYFRNIVEMQGLFVSTDQMELAPQEGTTQIQVNSSIDWVASSDQAWLSISPSNKVTGCDTLILNIQENTDPAIRKATITIAAAGNNVHTIDITQHGQFLVSNGNLKTILSDQLTTLTHLTLKGTIDARDFKTMRDDLPALKLIDLSGATIVAYTGTEGPNSPDPANYPANEIPQYAFYEPHSYIAKTTLNSIVIPSSVSTIGTYAFARCSGLTNVTIPSSVKTIGSYTFLSCRNLSNIYIPQSVTKINNEAFNGAGLMEVAPENPNYASIDGVLFNKEKTKLVQFPGGIKYESYTIPSSVHTIQELAFKGCYLLGDVVIPPSVHTIEQCSFESCVGLYNISIPPKVTTIKLGAFSKCNNVEKLVIPSSVTSIEALAFAICIRLKSIYVFAKTPPTIRYMSFVFIQLDKSNCTLFVPQGTKAAYEVAIEWNEFPNIVEMETRAPIANAGNDQTVHEGDLVSLDGSASYDLFGDTITYRWTAPEGVELSSTSDQKPTFTAPEVASDTLLTFTLVVNNGTEDSPKDEVKVAIKNVNRIPTAHAGSDQDAHEGDLVMLDGSASNDPFGKALTYSWTAPEGIELSSTSDQKPTFTAPEVGEQTNLTFTLVVSNGTYASQPDSVIVQVDDKTGIKDIDQTASKYIRIYPNPTSGRLVLNVEDFNMKVQLIEIYNSKGQLVFCTEPNIEFKTMNIDLSSFHNGLYTLKINTKETFSIHKIIKQ